MVDSRSDVPFDQVFAQSPNAMAVHTIVLDSEGRPVDYVFDAVNQGFETVTGLRAADIVGRRVKEVLPETESLWIERYGEVALTGISQSFTSYSQELGCWYAVSAYRHKPLGFTVSFVDISDVKRAEAQVRHDSRQFTLMLMNMQVGILLQGPRAEILLGNPKALELLGLTEDQLLGKTPYDPDWRVVHEDGTALPDQDHPVPRAIASRSPVQGVTMGVYRPRTADWAWLLVDAEPLLDDRGEVEQVVCTFIDISRRKRAEEEKAQLQAQLQHSQKMENLGSLAGGIAHDMNNVLAAILTLASAKMLRLSAEDPLRRAFETIAAAADRGGKMVKSLLEFARQRPAEEKPVDLNSVILDQVRLLERTTLSRITIMTELEDRLPLLQGDATALSHALMNLCVNAADAMPVSGTLLLRTRAPEPGWVELEVVDSGMGMSTEVLKRATDPFFTTKPEGKGTGLGLSLVYSTVQAHNGTLELFSQVGKGTNVKLRFPSKGRSLPVTGNQTDAPAALQSLRVLLVDDDELVRVSLADALSSLGHRVEVSPSGEGALQTLGAGNLPDVVILDMNMPGLGGAATLAQLRARYPNLPVLLATGRVDQSALSLVSAFTGVTLLSKPFALEELTRVLQGLFQPKR